MKIVDCGVALGCSSHGRHSHGSSASLAADAAFVSIMEEVHEVSDGVQKAIGVPRLLTNHPLLVFVVWRPIELEYNQNVCARPVAASP